MREEEHLKELASFFKRTSAKIKLIKLISKAKQEYDNYNYSESEASLKEAYKIDSETGLIDYEESFQKEWLTHSQWGFSMCMTHGFKTVAKMIAAHHGRTEWGAIVDLNEKDLDPLVYLIHHIDDLSAKFGKTTISDLG